MKVIFFHVGDGSMPTMLARSIIKHGHEPVFLTDHETDDIPGCETHRFDTVIGNITWFRLKCYAEYNQPGIYLDSDMLVMRNLDAIMALDFDVALTKVSHRIIDPKGIDLSTVMPYNAGFIAIKDASIFPDMVRKAEIIGAEKLWYIDQIILSEMAKTRHLIELPVKIYNRTVKRHDVDINGAWVLHFKGSGKSLMEQYAKGIL